MTIWIGQVIVMIVLVGGAFLMGASINGRKQDKK